MFLLIGYEEKSLATMSCASDLCDYDTRVFSFSFLPLLFLKGRDTGYALCITCPTRPFFSSRKEDHHFAFNHFGTVYVWFGVFNFPSPTPSLVFSKSIFYRYYLDRCCLVYLSFLYFNSVRNTKVVPS